MSNLHHAPTTNESSSKFGLEPAHSPGGLFLGCFRGLPVDLFVFLWIKVVFVLPVLLDFGIVVQFPDGFFVEVG